MFTVECECGARLQIRDELAGKRGKCPKCGEILALIAQQLQIQDQRPTDNAGAAGGKSRTCPGCGAQIPSLSFSCEFCGAALDKEQATLSETTVSTGDSPELLVERFSVALGKMRTQSEGVCAAEESKALCIAILTKLRVFAVRDSNVRRLVDDLQRDFDRAVAELLVEERKDWKAIIITLIVLAILFGVAVAGHKLGFW